MVTETESTFKPEMMTPEMYPRALDLRNPALRMFAESIRMAREEDEGKDIKGMIERTIPRNLSYTIPHGLGLDNEGSTVNLRKLLLSSGVASTAFVQTQYANSVLEGAKLQRCARDAFFFERTTGSTMRLPIFGDYTGRAPEVAEGAEFPDSNGTPTYRDFTMKKYGEKSPISQELIDDSLYNTIALAAGRLGARIENSLNYETIGVILENSGKEHDCTGSNLGAKAVSAAMLALTGKAEDGTGGFMADSIVMTTEFEAGIRNEVVLTDYPGAEGVIRTGMQPYLFGLRQFSTNTTTSSTTHTWGYNSDGDIGALVYNMASAGGYVMREDISIENFREPLKDLTNVRTKIRFGVNYGIANAVCRIEY